MGRATITRQEYLANRINSMKTSGVPFLENIEYED